MWSTLAMSVPHASDSSVQLRAEAVIREALSRAIGVALEPKRLTLQGGATVHVDAASADDTVIAEIFARQGPLKGGQQKKVAIDTLKLVTLRRVHENARLVLAFADADAAHYATGGGWVAQALREWNVDVIVLAIPDELRNEIRAAQSTQKMVNVDEVVDDVPGPAAEL
jgi:hypothetical protein